VRVERALRLPKRPCLATVGAGGKTSLLFQLAREFLSSKFDPASSVVLTCTTHLADWQAKLADRHIVIGDLIQLNMIDEGIPSGLVVITGPEVGDGRLGGLSDQSIEYLHQMVARLNLPMLIEADGSRSKPLKAPGVHEPAIPGFLEQVIVCAGMSALGKPLTKEWVHRVEYFSALAGLEMGGEISPGAILRVLANPEGGLKGIPPDAKRSLLLTQADEAERQATAQSIAGQAISLYDSVLICTGSPKYGIEDGLSTIEVLSVVEPVAGIVLAAGEGERFGQAKQLLNWKGKPFVRQVTETALQAGLSPVIVVVGAYAEEVSRVLADLPVQITLNHDWQQGQSTSAQCGIRALPESVGAAIFLLSDQPQVPVRLVRSLVETHQQTLAEIVAPVIDGRRGNPVLFDRDTFDEFSKLQGNEGGRALFSHHAIQWLRWHDSAVLIDVDTPEDYQRLLEASHEKY
jgi:molybdenum cofactor cytidylyltransferase